MPNGGLQLPPGFRFHPTDEELVAHYLCRKCANQPISVPVITDLDLYKFDPWKLPERALSGEKEWYFFSPRDRKYPNGSRPNRAAGSGYWKATGADKPIGKPKTMGIKKALVFYAGKPPKGVKTNWIMHEYRLANVDRSAGNNSGLRLDDWVLCRIYNKKGSLEEEHTFDRKSMKNTEFEDQKPVITTCVESGLEAIKAGSDLLHFDTSESVPRCHTTDSSGSEHAVSTGNVKCNMEVQSALDFGFNYEEPFGLDSFNQSLGYNHQQDQLSSWQDMYMYIR